jgi:hypothetical protein
MLHLILLARCAKHFVRVVYLHQVTTEIVSVCKHLESGKNNSHIKALGPISILHNPQRQKSIVGD